MLIVCLHVPHSKQRLSFQPARVSVCACLCVSVSVYLCLQMEVLCQQLQVLLVIECITQF